MGILVLLSLLIVCSFAAAGLWTLWAARLPCHWFLRTLLVLAPISLLLLVPAYEPFVAFVIHAAVIVLGLIAARGVAHWRAQRREPDTDAESQRSIRFSLGSLLCVMLLVAAATAVAVRLPPLNWRAWVNTVLIGASCGAFVLLGAWFVRPSFRWWRVPLAALLCGALVQPLLWTDYLIPSFEMGSPGWPPSMDASIPVLFEPTVEWRRVWAYILPATAGVVGLTLFAAAWSGWAPASAVRTARGPQTLRLWRGCMQLLAIALCVSLAAIPSFFLFRLLFPDPIPPEAPPSPNGYEDLLAAASEADDPILASYDTATRTQLQTALNRLAPHVFERLERGLSHPSLVPLDYKDVDTDLRFDDIIAFRALARSLMGQAQVHRIDGDWDATARIYLDIVLLGERIRTGGLIIHALVGNAIAGYGQYGLIEVRRKLSPEIVETAAAELYRTDESGEAVELVLQRERIWSQHATGWHGRLWLAMRDLTGEPIPNTEMFEQAMHDHQVVRRLLILELALQAYTETHKSPPASLEDLVPQYLPHIPEDPLIGGAFVYSKTPDGYSLTTGRVDPASLPMNTFLWLQHRGVADPFSLDDWYDQNRN